jgi:hypothetical protein
MAAAILGPGAFNRADSGSSGSGLEKPDSMPRRAWMKSRLRTSPIGKSSPPGPRRLSDQPSPNRMSYSAALTVSFPPKADGNRVSLDGALPVDMPSSTFGSPLMMVAAMPDFSRQGPGAI